MPATVIIATIMRPQGDTGVQTHFRTYEAWLRTAGRETRVVTPYDAPLAKVYPMFALRKLIHPFSGPASVRWYRHWHTVFVEEALRRCLGDGKPCVVYAQCPLSAHAALRARASPSQKVILVVHFNVSQADEWAGKSLISMDGAVAEAIRAFESDVIPRLDGLVFVSQFMRALLQARIPAIAALPYTVVPNFVPDPGVPVSRRPEADLLCIGTLERRKNQIYALEIVAAARAMGQRLTLTIVGEGPDRPMLEVASRRMGLTDSVRFLGMVRNAAQLFETHRACLHVASIENLPLTLVEALSRGVPVFAAAVGGVPEVFEDGMQGRYLPLDDPRRAAKLVCEWMQHEPSMTRAGVSARARFLGCFESNVAASELSCFLDQVANSA